MDYLSSILDTRFLPHGHCFLWTTDIFWLHLVGDVITATAYYLIPLALAWFVWKSRHLPYPALFICFGVFILACGTTHILGVVTLWYPVYRLEGLVKAATALASIGTAIVLFPVIPKALRLRSPDELEALNAELERKNRELGEGRAGFRSIVDRNPEGILVLSAEDRIVFANPAAEGFLCMPAESLGGMLFDRPQEPGKVMEFGDGTGDGTRFAEVFVSETSWQGSPARLVILRDATARHRSEEALRRSQEQLQQAQRMEAVGRLAGGISHDFNNILTAINGFTSLALSKLPDTSPVREELVEVARSGERASQLTRQLLAFSRKQILSPREVDINKVVEDIGSMIRRVIGEDVTLETRLEEGLPDIRIDPGQLEQVLVNLAVNARDAMPEGGGILLETALAHFQADLIGGREEIRAGDYAMLSVSDHGVGMPPEVLDRLFEPFFTTKEQGKGTGLGLSTVYGIVKQSEGHILVYSEPGKGSTFKLYFPLVSFGPRKAEPEPAPSAAPRAGHETILLVEDESAVRKLVTDLLEGAGYTVLQAPDGVAALEKAEAFTGPIDLLLTDVIMAQMGGSALAVRLLGMRPGTRVLFMSGYTDDAVVRHGVQSAAHAFIQKPFSPSRLLSQIRQVLEAPQASPLGGPPA